jgi:hypothetical protein
MLINSPFCFECFFLMNELKKTCRVLSSFNISNRTALATMTLGTETHVLMLQAVPLTSINKPEEQV